jgi:pilus assembly protein Flp/PilA
MREAVWRWRRRAREIVRRFVVRDDGPTAAEYAVMLALILGTLILVVGTTGNLAAEWWTSNSDAIVGALGSGSGSGGGP